MVGEPGVGKSRLDDEFKLRTPHGGLVLETFSVSHGKAYPYLPLLELLKHYFQLTPQDETRTARAGRRASCSPWIGVWKTPYPTCWPCWGMPRPPPNWLQIYPPLAAAAPSRRSPGVLLRESLNQPLLLLTRRPALAR